MEQVPKVVRQRLQATAKTGMHPDPNLLTAFAEKTLREPERTRILQHLGNCADCRNILSLSMPQIEVPPSTSPISSPWLSWPLLRWGALAACVIVVGAAVTLHREWLPGRSPFGSGEAPTPPPPMGDVTDEGKASKQPPQKLAAKVVPPSSFQSDRDSLKAETLAKQDDQADTRSMATTSVVNGLPTNQEKNQLEMNQRLKAQLTKAPATNADAAKSSDKALTAAAQLAAPAAAASPATKTINTQGRGNERNDNLDYGARTGNEIVTTEAQAVPIEEVAPAARDGAKDESQKYDARKKAQSPSAGVLGGVSLADRKAETASPQRAQAISGEYDKLSRVMNTTSPRWTLSADGTLQRSLDSGRTWQTIPVTDNLTVRALSANDSDIWVGGAAGALYHSADAGQHWTQVKPQTDGEALTGNIITVKFTDANHGSVTCDNHQIWSTNDAGQSWYRK